MSNTARRPERRGPARAQLPRQQKARTRSGDTYTKIIDELRSAITRGRFFPNERLVEAELSQGFGFSRAGVRAALLHLETEGLVERIPNRGARVRPITVAEAVQISEARMVLEGLAAAKAAQGCTPEDEARLRGVLAEMRASAESADAVRYSELNSALHRLVWETARHPVVSQMIESLRIRTVRVQFRIGLIPGRPLVSLGEHQAIVEAIVRGDAGQAEQAMRRHLLSVISAIEQLGGGAY